MKLLKSLIIVLLLGTTIMGSRSYALAPIKKISTYTSTDDYVIPSKDIIVEKTHLENGKILTKQFF